MHQILVEIDDELAAQLRRVVPARSRGRSEFIRNAIRRALWAQEEAKTAAAYAAQPDASAGGYIDAEARKPTPTKRPRKKSSKP